MTTLLQTLINGLLYGGILSIAAVGFSLIFGVMNVINLTHGIFVVGGAYGALIAWSVLGIDPLLSIPPLMLIAFAVGWILQRAVIQPAVERGNPVAALLVTFGFTLVALNLLTVFFSSSVRSISPSYSFINLRLGEVSFDLVRLIAFGCGLALIAILGSFMRFSRWGRIIRATALSELGARLCGVDARGVYAVTFAVGSAFAAASGVLIGMMLPFTPAEEVTWTVYAFIVVTLGGVGSLGGAMLGGVLLGLVSALTQTYLGGVFTNMVMFLILLGTLLLRPNGILGSAFKASR